MTVRAGCVPLTDAQRDEAEKYLHLCDVAADRFARKYGGTIARGEFLSAAFDGLADAVRRFDDSRRVSMECYAPPRIAGACLDMMRRDSGGAGGAIRVTRNGHAAGLVPRTVSIDIGRSGGELGSEVTYGMKDGAMTFGDFLLPPAPTPPPDAAMAAREDFEALLVGLTATERFVVRKVDGPDGWSLLEVADHLGLSPSRVGQLHAAATVRIRDRAVRLGLGRPSERAARAAPPPRTRKKPAHGRDWRTYWRTPPPLPFDRSELPRRLHALGEVERRVVELRYGLADGVERTTTEIGQVVGLTSPTVFYRLRRALEKLGGMSGPVAGG